MIEAVFEPVRRPVTVDDRLKVIEEALGLAPAAPAPVPHVPGDPVAKLATLVGGIRVVAVPTDSVPVGERVPPPGVTVSVTPANGTTQLLRLVVGMVFEAGPVADQIEATAEWVYGLGVERIGGAE